jgi:predicted nucleic acid-binding protein
MPTSSSLMTAKARPPEVTGTLGVLDLAADRGLVDLVDVLDRLKRTNFRYRQGLFDALLKKHGE